MSALSLEKNGRVSSSKRTKHIKAKYFLIKDYYNAGEIDLRYCPTDSMWADVLTKPLQGQKFRDMRAFLQNCSPNYDDDFEREEDERGRARHSMKDSAIPHPSSRECVEDRPRQPGPRQPAPPQQHQLRACSPSGVAEIWAESGFDPDSDFVKWGAGARQRQH